MSVQIQFFGFSAYRITTSDGINVVIDPYLNDNPVSPIKAKDLDKVDLYVRRFGWLNSKAFNMMRDLRKMQLDEGDTSVIDAALAASRGSDE